ncbi:hypothetical protein [Sphingobium chlorophenolicum]|uniref:hypothetical protein n=1 Tax=Sphingobium chlorophenolicum TaxID=46429 RepID=UPI0012E7BCD7|nr:hypothetical protein [Sphingobium chlorophenolicum]
MIQDAPPPAYHCVKAEDITADSKGNAFVTLSGDPQQLTAFLNEIPKSGSLQLEAQSQANGVAFARLRGALNTPYREIGGLIYSAQRRHLAVAMTTDPLICEIEEK